MVDPSPPGTPAETVSPQSVSTHLMRLAGPNRYATAGAVYKSQDSWDPGLYVTSGKSYADALSATPLAGLEGVPFLLTDPHHLSPETKSLLTQAFLDGVRAVGVIGGTNTVSAEVEAEIAAIGFDRVVRLAGKDRYETAVLVAEYVQITLAASFTGAFVVDGTNFADALAAGPAAFAAGATIILTNGPTLPPASRRALESFNDGEIVAVGGAAKRATEGLYTQQVVGKDRYHTALALARAFPSENPELVIASGEDFPDALAAGALATRIGASLLLTPANYRHEATFTPLVPRRYERVYVVGGERAVNASVYRLMHAALGAF